MKNYNRYFVYLLAVLLVGCKKNKKVISSASTTVEVDNGDVAEEVEYVEKSVNDDFSSDKSTCPNIAEEIMNLKDLKTKYYFDFDRDVISVAFSKDLDAIANHIKEKNLSIVIYGNCDSRGSASYNVGLGSRRATSLKRSLISRGVSADKIRIVSLGQTILVEGSTEEAYAKNRVAIIEVEGAESILSSVKKNVDIIKTPSKSTKAIAESKVDDEDDDEDDDN